MRKLLADPARAVEMLGAVQNDGVLRRLEAARSLGTLVLDTQAIAHPAFPDATVRTPLIVKLGTADRATYLNEWFGPIAFVIATESTDGKPRHRARRGARPRRADAVGVFAPART